jgi:hypothetical protein
MDQERNERVLSLLNDETSYTEVADRLHLTRNTVAGIAHRAGKRKRDPVTGRAHKSMGPGHHFSVYLQKPLHRRLVTQARRLGINQTKAVRKAIEAWVSTLEAQG